jgi:hypothetical protein
MAGICAALAALFAFVALAPTQPVKVRSEHTPAAWSSR